VGREAVKQTVTGAVSQFLEAHASRQCVQEQMGEGGNILLLLSPSSLLLLTALQIGFWPGGGGNYIKT
jgi:hypothetical protein